MGDEEANAKSSKDDSDKMSEGFKITSVCRDDIIQSIEDSKEGDNLKHIFLIREAEKLTDSEMKWIASKLSDDFCNCCFWDNLSDRFRSLVKGKYNGN